MEQADLVSALQPHATKLKKKKQQTKKPQDIIDMVCRKRGYSLWVQPHQGDQDHQGNQQDPEVRGKNQMLSECIQ